MRGPWRISGFRWYWMTSSCQSVGQGMQFFALVWLVLDLTGSSLQLTGLVVFLYGIPNTLLLPLGGVIADRFQPKVPVDGDPGRSGGCDGPGRGPHADGRHSPVAHLRGSGNVGCPAGTEPAGAGDHALRPGRTQQPAGRGGPVQRLYTHRPHRRPAVVGNADRRHPRHRRFVRHLEHRHGPARQRGILRVQRAAPDPHPMDLDHCGAGPRTAGAEFHQRSIRYQELPGSSDCHRAGLLFWRVRHVPPPGNTRLCQGTTGF